MLGRTANGVFWMFRYIERAENTARLIDAGLRMSLTRADGADDEWNSVLNSAGALPAYMNGHDAVTASDAVNFLLRDKDYPSSIMSTIESARNNGRMVRTALTREAWESTNQCWIDLKTRLSRRARDAELPDVIDAIKQATSLIRGAFNGTMLRNEIYNFARIGTFIERADNTARILDVKYYVLLPSVAHVGTSIDNIQWESILRSVSAHRSYTWAYDSDYRPVNIADFLILNRRMPRSLAYCHEKINTNLGYLAEEYGERNRANQSADETLSLLKHRTIQDIMDDGLHEFLVDFIGRTNRLGVEIAEAYRFY